MQVADYEKSHFPRQGDPRCGTEKIEPEKRGVSSPPSVRETAAATLATFWINCSENLLIVKKFPLVKKQSRTSAPNHYALRWLHAELPNGREARQSAMMIRNPVLFSKHSEMILEIDLIQKSKKPGGCKNSPGEMEMNNRKPSINAKGENESFLPPPINIQKKKIL